MSMISSLLHRMRLFLPTHIPHVHRGPIVNKSDQQLFFVHTREGGPSAVARRGGRRRWKPLRCEANLYPSEAGDLEPTGGRGEAAVSSRFDSSDEEYNVGSDYKRVLKRRRRHCVATQQKNAKLRIQPTTGDLWTEEGAALTGLMITIEKC